MSTDQLSGSANRHQGQTPMTFQTISKLGHTPKPLNDGSGLAVLVPKKELNDQIKAAGRQLRTDYKGLSLTTIPILEGGSWIHGQTASRLPEASRHRTVSIVAKRYGNTKTGGNVQVYYDWIKNHPEEQAKIRGCHCLIFDDVLDQGETAAAVIEVVREFNPLSLKTFFMVRKEKERSVKVAADYVLFDTDDHWLIGAGLDEDGVGRDRPQILCKIASNTPNKPR